MPNKNKKDFSGGNKKNDTYDKDWVFVKNKHTKGPNDSAGAWMTQQQARQAHEQKRQDNAYQASLNNYVAAKQPPVPGVPTPPATTPIDVSGIGTPPIVGGLPTPPQTGDPKNGIPGVPTPDTFIPTWWNSNAIKNPTTPEQQFANIANALLPTLSPEDQRTLGSYLASNYKDVYGGYANTPFDPIPTKIGDNERKRYLGTQRAQLALNLLDRMKTASGAQDMGAGYDYLKNAVNLINQYATDGVMTREKYQQFTNAVGNLTKNAGSNLSAYTNLAQLFNLPSFTAGQLVSNTPNSNLFG